MPKPIPSQFSDSSDFFNAAEMWHSKLHGFAMMVEARVEEQYELFGSGDLCYNLQESGVIREDASVDEAARIVAMHIAQA